MELDRDVVWGVTWNRESVAVETTGGSLAVTWDGDQARRIQSLGVAGPSLGSHRQSQLHPLDLHGAWGWSMARVWREPAGVPNLRVQWEGRDERGLFSGITNATRRGMPLSAWNPRTREYDEGLSRRYVARWSARVGGIPACLGRRGACIRALTIGREDDGFGWLTAGANGAFEGTSRCRPWVEGDRTPNVQWRPGDS